ncbi:MAG: UDP-N-acetylmuramoyl-tripeptide--D-alanyl-D-alanine ligase [Chitinophagales bacterium]|nr:UDP-N-acetylmuramoyl-tripeptide--D-alanyl-D-alanine ligase [Chitinophagales bacterium]
MELQELYQRYLQSTGVCTDTRKIQTGNIYFALKGDNFDGNQFAAQALQNGASLAVVDNPSVVMDGAILVEDVLQTLQQLANYHRRQCPQVKVFAITGSNGKTTCKELVTRVLSKKYRTYATQGNFNNHIGVPLTILAWDKDIEVAVIEMGANHQGEIAALCEIAEPDYGLITSIGKAHLEGFGGVEGIKKGKGEMFTYLAKRKGMAFVNQNVEVLREMAKHAAVHTWFYGDKLEEVHGKILSVQPFVECMLYFEQEAIEIQTHLIGEYNFLNILSAAAIGFFMNIPLQDVADALTTYKPDNNRSQVEIMDGREVIFDAYNANPTSVAHAIKYFSELQKSKKWVVLGDMWELGDAAQSEHQAIVDQLTTCDFDEVILVGEIYKETSRPTQFKWFRSYAEVKAWLTSVESKDAIVLVKGSRGMQLEKVFK